LLPSLDLVSDDLGVLSATGLTGGEDAMLEMSIGKISCSCR
jgi:hypothetical protein